MSVFGYFGNNAGSLRLGDGDLADRVYGQVLAGELSVGEAFAVAARRAWPVGEAYESVAYYDPVLRAHCRLDQKEDQL